MPSTTIVAEPPIRLERRRAGIVAISPEGSSLRSDLRLFSATFAAGFLFVSLFIA
ncbi:hypothetical protein ACFQPG_11395 [Sphingomonas sp. GCM10030256]|uniref:hypothetical protein n=1 Tax=Sphingomonas sp. GCM10030256 TaxID=3273427 RepID=UPI0036177DEC